MTTVAVALIERDGKLLICRRRPDQAHAGKWEFPGGKVESGEGICQALRRELLEELGIVAAEAREVLRYDYSYSGMPSVRLVFFLVGAYRGLIDPSQFAEVRWESRDALGPYDFLEGDRRVLRELAGRRF